MSVNKVILVGNVGKDPDVRYVEKDVPVASFPLATTERGFKRQDGSEVPERTEWHNIVVWRGLAKVAEMYVRKGTSLYIEGKLRTRSWVDQNNNTRYITEVITDQMELLGKRPEGGVPPLSTSTTSTSEQPAQQPNPPFPPEEDASNDLPF
ncbi:MAG: single-stranded DNA-binding protein [Paludibacteraceae bacterium]|nr:single-stranded DNA-binding protein [Paludibacteraceae bacterium]MBO7635334.1 single-stranded DNA-binding protein [Paludibacteraceae bacterium]MBR5973007.1 single-stranded DNA-binding protein [Paludibacteraceae bacterium]